MATLPLGWIPDTPNHFDWRFGDSKIAAMRPLTGAASFDYRAFDESRVQLANSCVGHAVAAAAALCMAIAGHPIAFPSPLFAYTGARILEQARDGIIDVGCRPRLAMTWLRDRGMVAEERWPELSTAINSIPPLDAWQEGESATLESFYRIESGPGASDAIRSALVRGYCPVFAMNVDRKYEQLGADVYDSPGGASLGGHMQCIAGYSAILDAFLVRNTWGAGWGDGGYGWIAASFIDAAARDIWVISAAPEVR